MAETTGYRSHVDPRGKQASGGEMPKVVEPHAGQFELIAESAICQRQSTWNPRLRAILAVGENVSIFNKFSSTVVSALCKHFAMGLKNGDGGFVKGILRA